ncbi:MAG TPA: type II secretion system protein GspG, partial [Alphaproteobacteria bacterium]
DPWGRAYELDVARGGEGGELSCLGSDGRRGGRGDAADVELER